MPYDFSLRHGAVRSGAWVGFPLAFRNRGGVTRPTLPDEPRRRWRPWVVPSSGVVSNGTPGEWQWRFEVLCLDKLTDHQGNYFSDARTGLDMRNDLAAFFTNLSWIDLTDVDNVFCTVIPTNLTEELIAPYDTPNNTGGWLVTIEFVIKPPAAP